jgi:hypothetical protein
VRFANAILLGVDLGRTNDDNGAVIKEYHPLHGIHDKLNQVVNVGVCGEAGGVGLEATLPREVGVWASNLEEKVEAKVSVSWENW